MSNKRRQKNNFKIVHSECINGSAYIALNDSDIIRIKNELKVMWKEMMLVFFKVLSSVTFATRDRARPRISAVTTVCPLADT